MRTLLIDADVLAYQAASAHEQAIQWEPGFWTWHCEEPDVRKRIESEITHLMDNLKGDDYALCITDSQKNWRFDVLPTYKGNRASVKKPLVLQSIRQWMVEELGAYFRPRLEGDDILGILATGQKIQGEKVIVSIDKDMKTIPGLYFRYHSRSKTPVKESEIVEITEEEADQWHMIQTLAGDTTDGYSGCPGVGMTTAEKRVLSYTKLVPVQHELLRGPRKGEVETRWQEEEADNLWDVTLSHFLAAGLTEEDALVQARVSRILRVTDYDFKKKEPILWQPRKT